MRFLCYSPCLIVLIFPTAHEGCVNLQSRDQDVRLTQRYRERLLNALHRVAVMSCRWLSLAVCVSVCLSVSVCGIHYHIPPQRPQHRKKLHAFLPPL